MTQHSLASPKFDRWKLIISMCSRLWKLEIFFNLEPVLLISCVANLKLEGCNPNSWSRLLVSKASKVLCLPLQQKVMKMVVSSNSWVRSLLTWFQWIGLKCRASKDFLISWTYVLGLTTIIALTRLILPRYLMRFTASLVKCSALSLLTINCWRKSTCR